MIRRKSILAFMLIPFSTGTPTRNLGIGSPLLGPSVDAPKSLGIFDSSHAEKEMRSISVKYEMAGKYLSKIGLNPDDIFKLVALNYPNYRDPESTVRLPNADTQGGQGQEACSVGSGAHDYPKCADAQVETQSSRPANSTFFVSAFEKTSSGTEQWPLQDEISGALDVLYHGPIDIGTPAQRFTVDVDTGSADLWVPASCSTSNCRGRHFEASHSSTYRPTTQAISVTYGTGKVSGNVVTDTVSIAGLTVPGQSLGAVNNESDEFAKQPNDGLIGMAFGTIAQSGRPTFFENLIKEQKIPAPFFSVHLSRHAGRGSSVCLGCVNSTFIMGPVTWLPVVSKTYWTVNMDGLGVNNVKAPTKLTAAIDTGTSLIYVPDALASTFYGLIPGSKPASQYGPGFWTVPCYSVEHIYLSFEGHRFAINPSDFYLGRVSASSKDCVGGVLSIGNRLPPNLAIIGDEFLKSWYSTFDYGNGVRVGFWPDVNNK